MWWPEFQDNNYRSFCGTSCDSRPPTLSEHHSFVRWEAGGQRLAVGALSALPQVFPLHWALTSQPPEIRPVAHYGFMRALHTGHLLRSGGEDRQPCSFVCPAEDQTVRCQAIETTTQLFVTHLNWRLPCKTESDPWWSENDDSQCSL